MNMIQQETSSSSSSWEAIIGLEVHVELNTSTKIFCSSPNQFGDEPNTNIGLVSTAQPGSLPILNREVVRKAVQFGCAIHAEIASFSQFDRKSYFYPDSPRNFQITQFYHPIVKGGEVVADVEGKELSFSVEHAHLEDDAGMLKHCSHFTGVDYNRAGVPLLEIVSHPCIRSGKEAVAYVSAIRSIMQYIDASDCNMEEGSLRVDANISVRKKGEEGFRNKIEVKNMNSLSFLEMAIHSEISRQISLYERYPEKSWNELIPQGTYRWDEKKKETVLMRRKENADDYRYFPDPDLVPIVLDQEWIEKIRKSLPELPYEKKKRYMEELKLSAHDARILTMDRKLALYFEEGLSAYNHPKGLCNWITSEFGGRCREKSLSLIDSGISSANIARLVRSIDQKIITGKIAKRIADEMVENVCKGNKEKDCEEIIRENPAYQPMTDKAMIEKLVVEVLSGEEKSVNDYRNGNHRSFGYLVGQVMKASQGKASPEIVNELLKEKLQ